MSDTPHITATGRHTAERDAASVEPQLMLKCRSARTEIDVFSTVRFTAHALLFGAVACIPASPPQTPASQPSTTLGPGKERAEHATPERVGAVVSLDQSAPREQHRERTSGIDALESDVGGPSALLDLFVTRTDAEVSERLDVFGVGFVSGSGAALDCPKTFEESLWNTWMKITGEYYFIDARGRPARGYTRLPPIKAEARNRSCQLKVGRWGDAEHTDENYSGGHLVGSQLGGFGKRANMVPQQHEFNSITWVDIENQAAQCGSLPKKSLHYMVSVHYPDDDTLVPDEFNIMIINTENDASFEMTFDNRDDRDVGEAKSAEGVAFLIAQGCEK